MTTVLLDGRRLPHGDWEGDDFAPGHAWVTCTDTSAGRMLAYATNGRRLIDGKAVRAAIRPRDPDGVRLAQVKQAIEALTDTTVVIPKAWDWSDVLSHLRQKKGLIAQLWYGSIPRGERFQAASSFGHAVFISHDSPTSGCRVWDALDPNEKHHGNWVDRRWIRAAMEELQRREDASGLFAGYIPLQHL